MQLWILWKKSPQKKLFQLPQSVVTQHEVKSDYSIYARLYMSLKHSQRFALAGFFISLLPVRPVEKITFHLQARPGLLEKSPLICRPGPLEKSSAICRPGYGPVQTSTMFIFLNYSGQASKWKMMFPTDRAGQRKKNFLTGSAGLTKE